MIFNNKKLHVNSCLLFHSSAIRCFYVKHYNLYKQVKFTMHSSCKETWKSLRTYFLKVLWKVFKIICSRKLLPVIRRNLFYLKHPNLYKHLKEIYDTLIFKRSEEIVKYCEFLKIS